MEIRRAREEDKDPVLEFCKGTFSWGDYISEVWDKWNSSGTLYVCEKKGTVLGVYHIAFLSGGAWLEGMRVHPAYRKMGLGTMMMRHAESVIRGGTVRLVIESQNAPSIKLVMSVGYRPEEEWRLYNMVPEEQDSRAEVAARPPVLADLAGSGTYADSWRWIPLGVAEIERLVALGRVLVLKGGTKASAVGVWNRSDDFSKTFQVVLVGGSRDGMREILRRAQDMARRSLCEKIQVFAPEKIPLDLAFLEKKSKFVLMRKDLGKNL